MLVDSRSFDILIDTEQLLGWDVHHNLIFPHSFVMVPLESISLNYIKRTSLKQSYISTHIKKS